MRWITRLFTYLFKRKTVIVNKEIVINNEGDAKENPIDGLRLLPDRAHGVDLSHHNKGVSIKDLEQDFVFLKSTEGVSFVSPSFDSMAKNLDVAKIPWGSYHYYRPELDPIKQAKHFISKKLGTLPCVLDIEQKYNDRNTLVLDLRTFLEYVEKFTGKTPIIYSGYSYLVDLDLPIEFAKYPLWLAWYTEEKKVKAPSPWKNWTFWQYSESATVKGIFGKCDANLFKRN